MMLKSKELSNVLKKVKESINIAQQIYLGEEYLENIELEQRQAYIDKLLEIDESIYIKYKKLNTIKTDLDQYNLFKNILYSAIKELAA